MKKLIVSAFCLGIALTTSNVLTASTSVSKLTVLINNDEKVAVKSEELPEAIKKTLASDDFKGWSVKEAFLVKSGEASHYEVSVSKETETKIFKFDKEGALLK